MTDMFSPTVKSQIVFITCRDTRKILKLDVQNGNECCVKIRKLDTDQQHRNTPLISVSCQTSRSI